MYAGAGVLSNQATGNMSLQRECIPMLCVHTDAGAQDTRGGFNYEGDSTHDSVENHHDAQDSVSKQISHLTPTNLARQRRQREEACQNELLGRLAEYHRHGRGTLTKREELIVCS
jgi:hypothetical protein